MMRFNRNTMRTAGAIVPPTEDVIRNATGLLRASLDDAVKYGGELTRAALGAMRLRNDREHMTVDVKVHMLMPGMNPAIPGWHTDGAPRPLGLDPPYKHPSGINPPDLRLQEGRRPPRYHLLITGQNARTQFLLDRNVEIDIPSQPPTPDLYKFVTAKVDQLVEYHDCVAWAIEPCKVWEWDWWDLHRGVPAKEHGWRYLIRATESDDVEPLSDLRQVIRSQQQVYVSERFGW
jgi:hypothetical protein